MSCRANPPPSVTDARFGSGVPLYFARRSSEDSVLDAIFISIHLILSLALIALILLHAGRGGGLSDAFGGGMGPLGGLGGSTVAERNLDRLTVITAVLFAVTTLALAWVLD